MYSTASLASRRARRCQSRRREKTLPSTSCCRPSSSRGRGSSLQQLQLVGDDETRAQPSVTCLASPPDDSFRNEKVCSQAGPASPSESSSMQAVWRRPVCIPSLQSGQRARRNERWSTARRRGNQGRYQIGRPTQWRIAMDEKVYGGWYQHRKSVSCIYMRVSVIEARRGAGHGAMSHNCLSSFLAASCRPYSRGWDSLKVSERAKEAFSVDAPADLFCHSWSKGACPARRRRRRRSSCPTSSRPSRGAVSPPIRHRTLHPGCSIPDQEKEDWPNRAGRVRRSGR